MSNFKKKMAESKQSKGSGVDITDLLEDTGIDDLVGKAKDEGRFISLAPDMFTPDPNQPRKTFDQESLDSLQISIESNGQLQPILVRKSAQGKHQIIAGERRWRAISQSNEVILVDAIVGENPASSLDLLAMQISENKDREDMPVFEFALSCQRAVELAKEDGLNKSDAAKKLKISNGELSKNLALVNAPDEIIKLSQEQGVQDIEALYNLVSVFKKSPVVACDFIESLGEGIADKGFRASTKALLEVAKNPKKKAVKAKPEKHKTPDVEPGKDENEQFNTHEVTDFEFIKSDDQKDRILVLQSNGEKIGYAFKSEDYEALKKYFEDE